MTVPVGIQRRLGQCSPTFKCTAPLGKARRKSHLALQTPHRAARAERTGSKGQSSRFARCFSFFLRSCGVAASAPSRVRRPRRSARGARSPRRTLFIARASLELALERASGGRPRVVRVVSCRGSRVARDSRRVARSAARAPSAARRVRVRSPRAFVRAPSSAQGGPSRPVVVAISPRPRARRRAPGRARPRRALRGWGRPRRARAGAARSRRRRSPVRCSSRGSRRGW